MSWKDIITWNRKKDIPAKPGTSETSVSAPSEEQNPIVSLHQEMNRMFDNVFKDFGFRNLSPSSFKGWESFGSFSPKVNVSEDDKMVEVEAEIPGMEEKDIQVSLANDILTVKGEKQQEKEEKDKEYYHVERRYGSFQRVIQLPCEIKEDQIKASFKKGVLKITLPKSEKAQEQVKKIEIQGE
ncbi:MAG: Hsp20/alpha crystallin family protein [SAR324 cluster bacterium]|nr:Hsp20/alpha crystallin family protein [SAR324 cluster bacterium]